MTLHTIAQNLWLDHHGTPPPAVASTTSGGLRMESSGRILRISPPSRTQRGVRYYEATIVDGLRERVVAKGVLCRTSY